MTSKEALKIIKDNKGVSFCEAYADLLNTIEKDLDKLEKLEKENRKQLSTILDLDIENRTLKQALDKACERLDYTCPVEEELVEDLDCDECDNNCKECWKTYFMKEVLEDE